MMDTSAVKAAFQPKWIISRRQDLLWFQGSVFAGVGLLLVFRAFPQLDAASYAALHPAVLTLLFWGVLFDGTHVFATYARTYFAPDPESRAGMPGNVSWLLLAVGPAAALADYALVEPAPSLVGNAGPIFNYFLVAAFLWAYYHLVRQHYGFLSLYRRRAQGTSARADVTFLWVGSLYPFARFTLSDPYQSSGLPQILPTSWLGTLADSLDVAFALFLLGTAVVVAKGCMSGQFRLGPKHLFLVIVVGFHCLVFASLNNLLTITATLTIFHNLQYHRIVWQHEKGRNRVPLGNTLRFFGIAILFGALWYGPRLLGVAVASTDLIRNILLGLGWGIAFHHYFIDGRIWRIRRRPGLAHALDRGAA